MKITTKINRKKKTITITMPLQKATPSKSTGKTLVVASTHGCQTTEARHSGRPIVVTANAFFYSANRPGRKKQKVDTAIKVGPLVSRRNNAKERYCITNDEEQEMTHE